MATGSADKTLRLWNARTGKNIHILTDHQEHVYSVNYSPDGKTIASIENNNIVRLWNTHRKKFKYLQRKRKSHGSYIFTGR
ncbi:hypothetical protein F4212_14955 [Candidatus Poribacteria bacterium]|nr:hypothetical protein [Candidatus Poribacteria bacterium]